MKNQAEQQSRLKQRLVGAIVLVALGVIFIPMILDGEREQDFIVNGSSIPAKPAELKNIRKLEFDTEARSAESGSSPDIRIPVDEHSAPLTLTPEKPRQKEPSPAARTDTEKPAPTKKTPPVSVAPKQTKAVAVPVARAWAVQVGSFKQKNNALKLRDTLRAQKYTAFVEAIRSNGTLVYRVRSGPYVSREKAEQVREKLLAQQKMKGLVVKHP